MNTKEALAWIAETLEQPAELVTQETLRKDIPSWDSLGTLVLIAAFDEKFDIHLSEKDLGGMQRVSDVLELLRRNGKLDD
jgi:acyl carrier protein